MFSKQETQFRSTSLSFWKPHGLNLKFYTWPNRSWHASTVDTIPTTIVEPIPKSSQLHFPPFRILLLKSSQANPFSLSDQGLEIVRGLKSQSFHLRLRIGPCWIRTAQTPWNHVPCFPDRKMTELEGTKNRQKQAVKHFFVQITDILLSTVLVEDLAWAITIRNIITETYVQERIGWRWGMVSIYHFEGRRFSSDIFFPHFLLELSFCLYWGCWYACLLPIRMLVNYVNIQSVKFEKRSASVFPDCIPDFFPLEVPRFYRLESGRDLLASSTILSFMTFDDETEGKKNHLFYGNGNSVIFFRQFSSFSFG